MLWLRDRGALRDMVQITRTKGGRWSVRWGVDLTYCPAFRHGRLASKVEPHQATGDIIIDPLDSIEANTQWSATNLLGRPARRRIDRFVTGWTSLALRDLAELGDLEAIRNHFAAWNQKPVTRFGLANYIQSYLAWGLAGLATGNPQEGRMLINQFCETFGVSASHPVLLDAMAAFESQ